MNELSTPKKPKAVVAGPIRNSIKTKQKLIDAVGTILKEKGYQHINARNITDITGLNRKLINHYFGNIDNLIDTYLNSTDYWTNNVATKFANIIDNADDFGSNEIAAILTTLFDEVNTSADFRALLNWEVGEYNESLRKLADKREAIGSSLFKLTDKSFENSAINLRAILAIQIAGIYYLNLHSKINGSLFCEIDVNQDKGAEAIKQSLHTIIQLIYKNR